MQSVPPLPRKVEHQEGEPAYGLLIRTLEHNGTSRIGWAVDRMVGVRERAASRWDPTEIARICKADVAAVRYATPAVGTKTATVMGQVLSAEHIGIATRRWCPACLAERPYHRVWWDILPVTSCPEHGIKLTAACGCEGRSLRWRSGTLRHCPAGHPLQDVARTQADPDVLAFDAYVLDRLRAGDGERVREFDDLGLGELLTIGERLGKASFDESLAMYAVRKSYDVGRLHAEGFRILRGLPDTFDDLLGRLRVSEVCQKQSGQFQKAYGTLYSFVREMPGHSVGLALQSSLADHVRRNLNVRSGMRLDGRTPLMADRILVTKAADELGMLYGRLLDLLDRLAIPWERRAGTIEMSLADLESLRARLDGSRTLRQVGSALHLTSVEVAGLASDGLLDVVATGQGSHGWIFPANAGAELLAKLRVRAGKSGPTPRRFVSLPLAAQVLGVSIADVLRPVLDGSVEVRARWSKRQGLAGFRVDQASLARNFAAGNDAGVTLAVAAHRLGLTQNMTDGAMAASLLRTEAVGGVHRVKAEEVERFRARWATMPELRRAMGVRTWIQVAMLLRASNRTVCIG